MNFRGRSENPGGVPDPEAPGPGVRQVPGQFTEFPTKLPTKSRSFRIGPGPSHGPKAGTPGMVWHIRRIHGKGSNKGWHVKVDVTRVMIELECFSFLICFKWFYNEPNPFRDV